MDKMLELQPIAESAITAPRANAAPPLAHPIRRSRPRPAGRKILSDQPIRVHDRRMFTADSELREEYRDLLDRPPGEKAAEAGGEAPARPAPAAPAPQPAAAAAKGPAPEAPAKAAPEPVETASGATFQDLIALLAQSASVYLQQAAHVPLEHRAESLELARMHIDLLIILKAKTAGNLDHLEQSVLDDVLYRLRLAAVERT